MNQKRMTSLLTELWTGKHETPESGTSERTRTHSLERRGSRIEDNKGREGLLGSKLPYSTVRRKHRPCARVPESTVAEEASVFATLRREGPLKLIDLDKPMSMVDVKVIPDRSGFKVGAANKSRSGTVHMFACAANHKGVKVLSIIRGTPQIQRAYLYYQACLTSPATQEIDGHSP